MEYRVNRSQSQMLMHCFLFEPSVYISALVSLEGDITAEEVKEAVEKMYTQNETTMSKVILENGNTWFQNMPRTGCKVFIDPRDWREIMHESEKSTFRIDEGELVRSYIIPKEKGYSVLIMAHHITGDGKALITMIEDILCNLAGEEVEYKPLNREGMEPFLAGLKLPFFTDIAIKAFNAMWKKSGRVFNWEDYYNIHEKFWKSRQSDIRFEIVEKNQLDGIKDECKKMGVTVNSYMVTKLLQKHPEFENFCCPVSQAGENRSIANRVVLVRMLHKYDRKKTFEENVKEVHTVIKRHMEDHDKKYFITLSMGNVEPTLFDSLLMYAHGGYKNKVSEKVVHLFGYAGDRKTHLSVTNLQKLDFKSEYGRICLKNIVLNAACMSATQNVACISTFQDKMTISYCNIKNK